MTARNVELLEQVMQHIDDHPEQHQQDVWVNDCGTAACFAGWSAILTYGPEVVVQFGGGGFQLPDRHRALSMSAQAAMLLGLTLDEARTLFDACNTRGMLRLMVKDLVNGDELRDGDQYEREAGAA